MHDSYKFFTVVIYSLPNPWNSSNQQLAASHIVTMENSKPNSKPSYTHPGHNFALGRAYCSGCRFLLSLMYEVNAVENVKVFFQNFPNYKSVSYVSLSISEILLMYKTVATSHG